MNWIYHPEHEPQLVDDKEYEQLLEQGWYDTPAKFSKEKNVPCGTGIADEAINKPEELIENDSSEIKEQPLKKRGRPPRVKDDANNNSN